MISHRLRPEDTLRLIECRGAMMDLLNAYADLDARVVANLITSAHAEFCAVLRQIEVRELETRDDH